MKIRKHMIFSGEVQGVGFRYRAFVYAQELGLTGWVINLDDGRVEMEAQGESEQLVCLKDRLRNSRWIRILDIEEQSIPVIKERGFQRKGYTGEWKKRNWRWRKPERTRRRNLRKKP